MGRNKSKGPTKKNALILMTFILLVLSAFSPKLPLGILLCSVNWLDDLNLYLFHCPRLGCFSDLSAAAWRTMLVFFPNLFLTHFMIIFWIHYLQGVPKVSGRFFKNGCGIQISQATPTKFAMLFEPNYGKLFWKFGDLASIWTFLIKGIWVHT